MFKDLKFTFTDDDNIPMLKDIDKFRDFAFDACYEALTRIIDYIEKEDGIEAPTIYKIVMKVFHERFKGKLSPAILHELYLSQSTIITALSRMEGEVWDDEYWEDVVWGDDEFDDEDEGWDA